MLADFLVEAEVLEVTTGAVLNVSKEWFNFGYNQSTLQLRDFYLLSATFRVTKATDLQAAYARGRSVEIIRHRVKRYPATNTCGSFFRNFHEDEVSLVTPEGKKMIFVAYYLDKIDAKGSLVIGGARVSHQHANMLVTDKKATSADVIAVARAMQEAVYQKFGIVPQPECLLVGFKEYPLLKK
jgi:UDP-N-acetylmuramate dehydrogenase